jgi:cytochrome c
MLKLLIVSGSLAMIVVSAPVMADGDTAKGEMIFQRCVSCHSDTSAGQNKGPSLKGIVGRPVASVPGYNYSEPMKLFAHEHAVWDVETLDMFLKSPLDAVKGTKMMTAPVRRDSERADLIAFLMIH